MFLNAIPIIGFMIVLIILHELGHMMMAKLLGLHITKVGFQWAPYPHAFVSIVSSENIYKNSLYLLAGTFTTLCLLATSWTFNFWNHPSLLYAFAFQIILETNPFYSDFTIIQSYLKNKKNPAPNTNDHFFTTSWYLHFIIWTILLFQIKTYIS